MISGCHTSLSTEIQPTSRRPLRSVWLAMNRPMANRAQGLAAAPSSDSSVASGVGTARPDQDHSTPSTGATTSGFFSSATATSRSAARMPRPRLPVSSSATTARPTQATLMITVASEAGGRPRAGPKAAAKSGMPM